MKKILAACIAIILTIGFVACGIPAPTTPAAAPVQTPAATPSPAPEPTPTPVPFSFDNVFSEVFSDEALSALYPDIEDCDKERTRIFGNIARIEDFEFYGLTAEEQAFIKQAQQGNIDESSADELQEVLAKIYEKDPYVFDDVDNEVKIDNRIDYVTPELEKINFDTSRPTFYESTKEILEISNGGFVEDLNLETVRITSGTNVNSNYYNKTVLPDYKNNNWQGNYSVFDFSKFLLDGSQGQKVAKKIYQANVTFFNSEKEDVKEGLKAFIGECLNVLLINDALQKPDGINSVSSQMHYAMIYHYCEYVVRFLSKEMAPDIKCIVPDEYTDVIGLPNNNLNLTDLSLLMENCLGSYVSIYQKAVEELTQAQEKYS